MRFAGSWYPARAQPCTKKIEAFWASQPDMPPHTLPHTAAPGGRRGTELGVVPHAGWDYSGKLAAQVFRALDGGDEVDLVVVLGGHLAPGDPIVAMCEGQWETPFGAFVIHGGFLPALNDLTGKAVLETESRHYPDNSTELQLPFAKYKFPRAELLPIRVPPGPAARELGRRLAAYLEESGLRAIAVASTDLTHYGPNYGFEPQGSGEAALRWVNEVNDPEFIRAVESGEGDAIISVAAEQHNACSAGAVAALNELARAKGQRFTALGHNTSAEAGHPRTSSG